MNVSGSQLILTIKHKSRVLCSAITLEPVDVDCTDAQVALLTIYDRCKAADRGMTITDVKLLEKHGGKSGSWVAGE